MRSKALCVVLCVSRHYHGYGSSRRIVVRLTGNGNGETVTATATGKPYPVNAKGAHTLALRMCAPLWRACALDIG